MKRKTTSSRLAASSYIREIDFRTHLPGHCISGFEDIFSLNLFEALEYFGSQGQTPHFALEDILNVRVW
jgi:hypothetical protein